MQQQFKEEIDTLQKKIQKGAEEQQKLTQTLGEVDKRKEEEFRVFSEQMNKEREQERQRYENERKEYRASIEREEALREQQRRKMERMERDKATREEMARKQEEYRREMEHKREADERRMADTEDSHRKAKEEWEEQLLSRKVRVPSHFEVEYLGLSSLSFV